MYKKTSFLFLMVAFLFSAEAVAQGLSDFGVKAGVTAATLRGDDADDAEYKVGFVGGLYATLPLSPGISLQPEVLYTQKGATGESEQDQSVDVNLDYIEVPVLLKFTVPSTGNVTPSLYAGPYAAFAVRQEISGATGDVDIEEALNDTEYGVTLGGDLEFLFSGQALTLGARYDLGLSNIFEEDLEELGVEEAQTGTIAVTLGITL